LRSVTDVLGRPSEEWYPTDEVTEVVKVVKKSIEENIEKAKLIEEAIDES
jgi:hypothetical protein